MPRLHNWTYFAALILAVLPAAGANLDDSSLNGDYFVRQVEISTSGSGQPEGFRSLLGTLTFDGAGNYSLNGLRVTNADPGEDYAATGAYSVAANGVVVLTNPLRTDATINARLGAGLLLGSTTETAGVADLLAAVPAPATEVSAAHLTGRYHVAGLGFSSATAAFARSMNFQMEPDGAGAIPGFPVRGNAANLGGRPLTQAVSGATYSLTASGAGSIDFPAGGAHHDDRLVAGARAIYASASGGVFLIGGTTPSHDLLIGIRARPGEVSNADWTGLHWSAGLRLDSDGASSFAGSLNATGAGRVVWSKRLRAGGGNVGFTGVNAYSLTADGSGTLGLGAVALGSDGFNATAVSVLAPGNYELQFGVPATPVEGEGVFLHPNGIVNAASFAPAGNPVSPGAFVTLFGSNLAPATEVAAGLPFPLILQGVRVLVNGEPAPVYVVSPTQLSVLVPHATQGDTATFIVENNGEESNPVAVRLAATSPGLFTVPPGGIGPGAILKTDWSVVSPANPVRPGDVIQVFLTGLGEVQPPVPDGAAAPADPLSWVVASVDVYIGGKRADVLFRGMAPNLAGLYQLNVKVPADAPTGNSIPFAVETPNAFHDQADIAITP